MFDILAITDGVAEQFRYLGYLVVIPAYVAASVLVGSIVFITGHMIVLKGPRFKEGRYGHLGEAIRRLTLPSFVWPWAAGAYFNLCVVAYACTALAAILYSAHARKQSRPGALDATALLLLILGTGDVWC
jgi:hypothetical protein